MLIAKCANPSMFYIIKNAPVGLALPKPEEFAANAKINNAISN